MNNTIDIKSSTLNKSLDGVKDFLEKLAGPSIEEIGLLFSDKVKLWRFKNQIKILEKAKKIAIKNNINTKSIPLKILVPFLENSSLEEDINLQEKWANLLVNMSDFRMTITTNIFPYILSQLSSVEAKALLRYYTKQKLHYEELYKDYGISDEQVSNLIRLGLVKRSSPDLEVHSPIRPTDWQIQNNFFLIESEYTEITELGTRFVKVVEMIN